MAFVVIQGLPGPLGNSGNKVQIIQSTSPSPQWLDAYSELLQSRHTGAALQTSDSLKI